MPSFTSPKLILLLAGFLLFCSSIKAQSNPGKIVFADQFGRLLLINADGTGQTVLTQGGSVIDNNPVFSPDGSKIAFDRKSGFKTEIYIINVDGTNPVAVTSGEVQPESLNLDPSWSPDGTRLVFATNRSGSRTLEIWTVKTDGSGLVRLSSNVQLSTDGFGPIFSQDGNPAWSPDGTQIVYASTRDGLTDTELYVVNSDGSSSNPTRLTDNTVDDRIPTWSPDSQKIAFHRNGSSSSGINIINRDGTNSVNITNEGFDPAWSPDGSRFACLGFDPTFKLAIFIMNVDGTNRVKITNNAFDARSPAWAPISTAPVPTFSISGQIKDGNGGPISGASLNLFGTFNRTTQSDATGAYSFAGLATGNYRIDISKAGFGFTPPSITFNNLSSNQTANFTAFVAFSISGNLTGVGDDLLVTLTGTENRSVFTRFGQYSFDLLPAGGNYTVSINTPIFNITPGSVTFNNLSANQIANFAGVRATYTISGTITRLGSPKPGITVQLQDTTGNTPPTTTTDGNGQYSFTGVPAGRQYFVRPVGANYIFQPQTRDFNPLDGNKTADFVANSVNHLLFSRATFTVVEGTPNVQVTVLRGGNATGVGPITVQYETSDVTATTPVDYAGLTGTLNFPDGSFAQTITIPIFDDQLREGAEQFSITLRNPTGEVDLGTPSTATVTIADNDVRLITEVDSDRAIAVNTTSLVAEPFSLTTQFNFSNDKRTRISLFVENLQFNQGFPPIIVEAMDSQLNTVQLPLEAIASFSAFPFTQLIVRLPENLSPGVVFVAVRVNGQLSNSARISIQP